MIGNHVYLSAGGLYKDGFPLPHGDYFPVTPRTISKIDAFIPPVTAWPPEHETRHHNSDAESD